NLVVRCIGAEPGRQARNVPDGGVIVTAGETDLTKRCVAVGHPSPETYVELLLSPRRREPADLLSERHTQAYGALSGVRARQRVVEQQHSAVAGKPLNCGFEGLGKSAD